jgi:predicted DNA-binding protein
LIMAINDPFTIEQIIELEDKLQMIIDSGSSIGLDPALGVHLRELKKALASHTMGGPGRSSGRTLADDMAAAQSYIDTYPVTAIDTELFRDTGEVADFRDQRIRRQQELEYFDVDVLEDAWEKIYRSNPRKRFVHPRKEHLLAKKDPLFMASYKDNLIKALVRTPRVGDQIYRMEGNKKMKQYLSAVDTVYVPVDQTLLKTMLRRADRLPKDLAYDTIQQMMGMAMGTKSDIVWGIPKDLVWELGSKLEDDETNRLLRRAIARGASNLTETDIDSSIFTQRDAEDLKGVIRQLKDTPEATKMAKTSGGRGEVVDLNTDKYYALDPGTADLYAATTEEARKARAKSRSPKAVEKINQLIDDVVKLGYSDVDTAVIVNQAVLDYLEKVEGSVDPTTRRIMSYSAMLPSEMTSRLEQLGPQRVKQLVAGAKQLGLKIPKSLGAIGLMALLPFLDDEEATAGVGLAMAGIPPSGGGGDDPPDEPKLYGGEDWQGPEGQYKSELEEKLETGKKFNPFTGEEVDLTVEEVQQINDDLPENHRLKETARKLLRNLTGETGAVRIPNWLLGGFPELQEAATGPPVEGTRFPRLTEEDLMDVIAEDARRQTPKPRAQGAIAGDALTTAQIARLKEQERIIQNAKDAKRRQLNRERRVRQEAADIEWRKRNLSAIRPELQWQVDLMTGAADDVVDPPPPLPDNLIDARGRFRPVLGPVLEGLEADVTMTPTAYQRAAIEAAIEEMVRRGGEGQVAEGLEWIAGGPDDMPLWMRNQQARQIAAEAARKEFRLLQGEGKIPRTTQLKNWAKDLGTQAKELGRANYKDITPTETDIYKGYGKATARGLFGADVALQAVDAVDRLIKGDDPVEIAKSVTTQGVYDIYKLYEQLKEDKLRGADVDSDFLNGLLKLTTPMETRQDISERRLSDAAAARAMAERSGFEVTEEFGSGAVASGKLPNKTKAPVSVEFGELEQLSEDVWDDEEEKKALEQMGISWEEVLN